MKSGNLNFLEPSGPLQACNGTAVLHVSNSTVRIQKDGCMYKCGIICVHASGIRIVVGTGVCSIKKNWNDRLQKSSVLNTLFYLLRLLILMHVKRTIPHLYIQPSS